MDEAARAGGAAPQMLGEAVRGASKKWYPAAHARNHWGMRLPLKVERRAATFVSVITELETKGAARL